MEHILERVYIETPVDTDGDGKLDLIAAYIRRPAPSMGQEPVPAVMVANPYMMTCNEDWYKLYDVNKEVKAYPQQNIKEEDVKFNFDEPIVYDIKYPRETAGFAENALIEEFPELDCISKLYSYLNDKGYASVFCGGLGTLGSEGFTLTGSREEILAFKSVIDWLNGRCRAFTNKTDNIEVKADWCTGKVAMSAKSYLGTMCIGVAATGVDGLETIIPEAGISNWYNYYRTNGLVVPPLEWQGDDIDLLAKYCFSRAKDEKDYESCKGDYQKALDKIIEQKDRESGNYNKFWDERNYLNQVDKIKASVFIIHGINDWNVKTNQCCPLFQALEKAGIERKMLLHQGEHIYVYDLENSGVLGMIERWLDHYLKGIDNGAEKEPKVIVESNLNQAEWLSSDCWPPCDFEYETFPIFSENDELAIIDDLNATVYNKENDNQREWRDEIVLNDDSDNRAKFIWNVFENFNNKKDIRMSGSIKVAFEAAIDQKTAVLSAMLVDLGEDSRLTAKEILVEDSNEKALNNIFKFGKEETPSKYKIISRGHLNAQNRTNIWSKEELEPGKYYSYNFEMTPTDYIIKSGHKLGLIIYGTDVEQTLRQEKVTIIKVKPATIDVKVPLIR